MTRQVAARTGWTLTAGRNYIDATAFGDTNRTYLVGLHDITFSVTRDGVDVQLNLGRFVRRAVATTTAPMEDTTTADATGTINGQPATGTLRFNNNFYTTTNTNIQFTGYVGNVPTTVNVGGLITREEFERTQRRINENFYTNNIFAARTPEQVEADRKAMAKREKDQQKAYDKAMVLLLSHLSEAQLKQVAAQQKRPAGVYDYLGAFEVQGKVLRYRIKWSKTTADVWTVSPRGNFCIKPRGEYMPGPDQALALKLLIEADEREFLLTGNWSGKYNGFTHSLSRLDIDGTPSKGSGYTSRLYGVPDQPTDENWRARYFTQFYPNDGARYIRFAEFTET